MKQTFIVETGTPDANGDILMLDGVKIPDKVMLTREFNHDSPLGFAEVKREGNTLKAEADIPDELLDLHPAIGFQVLQYRVENGHKIFDEVKLHYVGLCSQPNLNPEIKSIREQLKNQ